MNLFFDLRNDSNRCAVVATLVNVVNSLRGNHTSMQAFLTNVIHVCTDISSPAHIYLLGDGLALWIAFLHNTNQITENLLQLFNNIYGAYPVVLVIKKKQLARKLSFKFFSLYGCVLYVKND